MKWAVETRAVIRPLGEPGHCSLILNRIPEVGTSTEFVHVRLQGENGMGMEQRFPLEAFREAAVNVLGVAPVVKP